MVKRTPLFERELRKEEEENPKKGGEKATARGTIPGRKSEGERRD